MSQILETYDKPFSEEPTVNGQYWAIVVNNKMPDCPIPMKMKWRNGIGWGVPQKEFTIIFWRSHEYQENLVPVYVKVHLADTGEGYEDAGVEGVYLEPFESPKHCGFTCYESELDLNPLKAKWEKEFKEKNAS